MMWLLAIDTIGSVGSVALLEDGALRIETRFAHHHRVSGAVLAAVEFITGQVDITLKEIDVYAVDCGPGFFTGVKIGVEIAKTLAHVHNKPMVGIGSLEALAYGIQLKSDSLLISVLPARKGEVYYQLFTQQGTLAPPQVAEVSELAQRVAARTEPTHLFVGEGCHLYRDQFTNDVGEIGILPARFPSAEAVAMLAHEIVLSGKTQSAFDLLPNYIKPPSISIPKRAYTTL
jgi:tRNA threonylcarbamoyladenosine biosynthesis protein TsaB